MYAGTYTIAKNVLPKYGIEVSLVEACNKSALYVKCGSMPLMFVFLQIFPDPVYAGTYTIAKNVLPKYGIEVSLVEACNKSALYMKSGNMPLFFFP